ncbi:hypothetical protein ACP70R_022746 [Stipagrostis hirtigluma subsp. patula]
MAAPAASVVSPQYVLRAARAAADADLQVQRRLHRHQRRRLRRAADGRPLLQPPPPPRPRRRRRPGRPLRASQVRRHYMASVQGDSNNASDLLFSARASSRRWPERGLDVFLAGNTALKVADFRIKGDYNKSCYFYLGNSDTMVASMNRMRSFGRRIFGVSVFPQIDHAFIAALVVIFDGVVTVEVRRRQQNQ